MESEERECREYEADLINGTGERETIDQGIDEIEGKDWNEGIFLSDSLNLSDKNQISWKSQPISINLAGKQFARLKISTR